MTVSASHEIFESIEVHSYPFGPLFRIYSIDVFNFLF